MEHNGASKLNECMQDIDSFEKSIKNHKIALQDITNSIDRMQKQRSEIQVIQRSIDDNLRFRQLKREKKDLEDKAKQLEKKISDFDSESIEIQYRKLEKKFNKLSEERVTLQTMQAERQVQYKNVKADLKANFENIETLYADQLILVKTETMALKDLETYSMALDK
jgi:chromosome segregation ATPase